MLPISDLEQALIAASTIILNYQGLNLYLNLKVMYRLHKYNFYEHLQVPPLKSNRGLNFREFLP